jgi:hypothetical protein
VKIRIFCSLALGALALTACGDDPFLVRWEEFPLESEIYALDRTELNRVSGFSMLDRAGVVIEDPQTQGRWDFAVERQGDGMVLVPPRVLGVISTAGVAVIPQVRLEDVLEAPADTARYATTTPVPVEFGNVYVIRTHQQGGIFGEPCVYYGKLEAIEVRMEEGVFRFRHDVSPDCNNRSLVPPR